MKKIIKMLSEHHKTIATMESCTGGGVANAITNIPGASDVIKFSAVTYSNEYKIKMGVSSDTISKYSVYSEEVAREMSYNITKHANSNYGIGITGKINNEDKNNLRGEINCVFISIYSKDYDKYYTYKLNVTKDKRKDNKEDVIKLIKKALKEILVEELK